MFIEEFGFIGWFGLGVHNMIEDFVCYWCMILSLLLFAIDMRQLGCQHSICIGFCCVDAKASSHIGYEEYVIFKKEKYMHIYNSVYITESIGTRKRYIPFL